MKKIITGILAAVIVVLLILISSVSIVKTGQIGIVTRFGAVQEKVLSEGINFKLPFIERVHKLNCKIQKMEISNNSASKDLQDVGIDVAINYCISVEQAPNLYKTVGKNYEDTILTPSITDAIKSVTAQYTAEELITKRAEVADIMLDAFNKKLNSKGITIVSSNIIDLQFSEAFNTAIEEKQVAQQEALKAKEELEKTKIEAEKKIVEAEATAEANKIINESLTNNNLEKQRLENEANAISKWDGVLPSTITGDAVPFINIKE